MATHGEIRWPPAGSLNGRLRETPMAAVSGGVRRHGLGRTVRRLRGCPGADGGARCYLSALRAADVHAFVRSRRKFAWAVAMLETHSMSLDPGPRSRESETALRVDS